MSRNDQEYLVQKIRTQYTEKQYTELDELKALDRKVKKPANLFAYVFGCVAALVMGAGMSLIMTDLSETLGLANPMTVGVTVGVVGLLMAIVNYPLYKRILTNRRRQYASQIMEISDKLIQDVCV